MKTPIILEAEDILRIAPQDAHIIFPGDEDQIRARWQALALQWSPNANASPWAERVETHLAILFGEALTACRAGRTGGSYPVPALIGAGGGLAVRHSPGISPGHGLLSAGGILKHSDGAIETSYAYAARGDHELGEVFIAPNTVVWTVDPEYQDLFEQARSAQNLFRFADQAMRVRMLAMLPTGARFINGPDGMAVVVPKASNFVRLEDLKHQLGNTLDPRHVAWIQSTQYDLACWLEWAGLCHGAISPDTWFVSPLLHSGALLGGWWYAVEAGAPLRAASMRTLSSVPRSLFDAKRGDIRIDLEAIRANGRALLAGIGTAPYLCEWLEGTTSGSAIEDYRQWRRVVELQFGKPKFVKLDLDFEDIYGSTPDLP